MKGYQVAVAVLAVLLAVTVGILFYVLADRASGGGEASQTAGSQRQTVSETGTRDERCPGTCRYRGR